jgi:hypothetical protein
VSVLVVLVWMTRRLAVGRRRPRSVSEAEMRLTKRLTYIELINLLHLCGTSHTRTHIVLRSSLTGPKSTIAIAENGLVSGL